MMDKPTDAQVKVAKTWQETVIQQRYLPSTHDGHLEMLQKQAEISFNAGYEKAKKEFELQFNPDYLDFQKGVEVGRKLGTQAGRREVVEWIDSQARTSGAERFFNADGSCNLRATFKPIIFTDEWQALLKEWGIR